MSRRTALIAGVLVLLLAATAALYTNGLDTAPPYLAADEAHFASNAEQLARDGTTLRGHRLPIFFHIIDPLADVDRMHAWYQPFLFYLIAIDFRLQPVTTSSLRMPVALLGVLNVLLIYLVGARLFQSRALGLAAAGILAIAPAHFLFSRMAVDYLCPLPFVLGWLWLALRFAEHRRTRDLVLAAVVLGCGLYTYISSWLMMPLLGVLTVIALRPPRRAVLLSALALAAPTLLILPFQSTLGVVLADVISRYQLASTNPSGPMTFALTERVALLWDYFNPSFLFFAGGSDLLMATSRAGLFLWPMGVLMAIGIYALLRRRTPESTLLLCGLVIAPLPIAIAMPEAPGGSTGRALTMLVFGVLIAIAGIEALWRRSTIAARGLVVVLVAMLPIQFHSFRADYLSEYQDRSWRRFDPNATRDVVAKIVDLDRIEAAPAVLLNDDGDDKAIRWRFYTVAQGHADLWQRTRYFQVGEPSTFRNAPLHSLVVMHANDPRSAALVAAGWSKVATITGIDGEPATEVFRRDR